VFRDDPDCCIGEPYGVEPGIFVKSYHHQVMNLALVKKRTKISPKKTMKSTIVLQLPLQLQQLLSVVQLISTLLPKPYDSHSPQQ